jgi:outer membrane protein TolC
MKLRSAWWASLVGAALAAATGPLQAQVSLATVVDLAQRNSAAVRIATADVQRARAAFSETRDLIIPSVNFGTGLPTFPEVGFTGTPPSLWTASVQSLIFGFPQKKYINAARLGVEAANSTLRDAREQVALDASVAYIELDTASRELEAAQQQMAFADRLVAIEEARAEAGVDSLSELLEARLTAAEVKLRLVQIQSHAAALSGQLASLTGLPEGAISPEHASIPEIPELNGDVRKLANGTFTVGTMELLANSKLQAARGDQEINYLPQLSIGAQYNRNTTLLNDVNSFFARPLPANNFSTGISIQIPIFDMAHRAKARGSAAEALRAKVEAEQAQRQNDLQISELSGTLRELDALAEVASLKQQLASEQLRTVLTEMEVGNGAGVGPGSAPQASPKAEQLARIDERQKYEDALDAGFDLSKARLSLLRALGHMDDWVRELSAKQP